MASRSSAGSAATASAGPSTRSRRSPNEYRPVAEGRLTEGLVLTIEPIISAGSPQPVQDADGWTIRTRDGSLSAHHEHTLVITRGEPLVLTAA